MIKYDFFVSKLNADNTDYVRLSMIYCCSMNADNVDLYD